MAVKKAVNARDINGSYPVTLTPDDGTILVTFVDVPEAITFGSDEEEALLHAVDALESALAVYVAENKPLPQPTKPECGQHLISMSKLCDVIQSG